MTTEDLTDHTQAERQRLADILSSLHEEQWAAPSLCTGWRIREVVAHITMPYRIGAATFFLGLARSRFNFNRYADRAARADAARFTDAELLETLRANTHHPWRPPGGGQLGALSHDVIHGLDITEPLRLPSCPPERIALVLRQSGTENLGYFGVDLTGRQLIASDAQASLGEGTPVHLPAKDILLIATGRYPVPSPGPSDADEGAVEHAQAGPHRAEQPGHRDEHGPDPARPPEPHGTTDHQEPS